MNHCNGGCIRRQNVTFSTGADAFAIPGKSSAVTDVDAAIPTAMHNGSHIWSFHSLVMRW
jgi:hypothetical protein